MIFFVKKNYSRVPNKSPGTIIRSVKICPGGNDYSRPVRLSTQKKRVEKREREKKKREKKK